MRPYSKATTQRACSTIDAIGIVLIRAERYRNTVIHMDFRVNFILLTVAENRNTEDNS